MCIVEFIREGKWILNHICWNGEGILNKQASTISDYSIFDFNYVPQNPLIREETKQIIDAFLKV